MYKIGLKMLTEERSKFIGMVLSLSFSALIITQQAAIFVGLMMRTYSVIADTPQADIWVMNSNVQMIDDIQPLRDTDLFRIRSIEGVAWAVPFFKGLILARLSTGQFQTCVLIGIDDSSLIGGPHTMLSGNIEHIRHPNAVIVDKIGTEDKLARDLKNGSQKKPLTVGETIELNDQRAYIAGICQVTRPFFSQPIIYTTYTRALSYSPYQRKQLSFIVVKSDDTHTPQELCTKISRITGFAAHTKSDFENLTINYYLKNTGIPLNFGIAVLLGLLIGAIITGQIFYNFTTDNLKYLALFSIMGASRYLLAKMTILQALWVAFLGWGIGSGAGALIGFLTRHTELSFYLSWELFFGTGILMFLICIVASSISITRIYNIELGNIFK